MKLSDAAVVNALEPFHWNGGWNLMAHCPHKLLLGRVRRLSRTLGIHRSTLRRRVERLGYQRAKVRGGMCYYCVHFETHEVRLTKMNIERLQRELKESMLATT